MKKTLVMTVAILTAAGPAFAAGSVQAQDRGGLFGAAAAEIDADATIAVVFFFTEFL